MFHDIVLVRKYGNLGITKNEVDYLLKNINQDEVFPVDYCLRTDEISLIGFISKNVMDALEYDHYDILEKISKLVDLETEDEQSFLINDDFHVFIASNKCNKKNELILERTDSQCDEKKKLVIVSTDMSIENVFFIKESDISKIETVVENAKKKFYGSDNFELNKYSLFETALFEELDINDIEYRTVSYCEVE